MPKYWVLIPAYKPDSRLIDLIEKLRGEFDLLVVDDGGGEAFAAIFNAAKKLGATVLHHDINRGKGAAIKTGLSWLKAQPDVLGVITADADGQHAPEDVRKIARAMEDHPKTIIIGGRDFSHMPARSRFGNTVTRFFFRLGTGSGISDTQSGLRGLPSDYFEQFIATKGDRYEYEMNVLLSLGEWGAPALEIPINTIYIDDNSSSHFNAVKDGLKVFSRVMRFFLSSILCTAIDYALFALFLSWLPASFSYAAARALSCVLNYLLNAKMVFLRTPTAKNALGYFSLAIAVMAIGSAGVKGLTALGLGSVIAKILVDCVLFVLNYFVQKKVIFKK
ncbi:MAG: glycosyltransferase [Christensenellales bacterium]|jgi:glycosyltransferase involved in cell wall biosynthesis